MRTRKKGVKQILNFVVAIDGVSFSPHICPQQSTCKYKQRALSSGSLIQAFDHPVRLCVLQSGYRAQSGYMATGEYDSAGASAGPVSGYTSAARSSAIPAPQQYSPPDAYGASQGYGSHSSYGGQAAAQPTYSAQPAAQPSYSQSAYSQPAYSLSAYSQQATQSGHRASAHYEQPTTYLPPAEPVMGSVKRNYSSYASQVKRLSAADLWRVVEKSACCSCGR